MQSMSIATKFGRLSQVVSSCVHLNSIDSKGVSAVAGIWTVSDHAGVDRGQWAASMILESPHRRPPVVEPEQGKSSLLPFEPWIHLPYGKVTDVCGMMKGILICLVRSTSSAIYLPQLGFTTTEGSQPSHSMTLGRETAFSCAFDDDTQNVAFGMETGGLVGNWFDRTHIFRLFSERQSIFCMTFKPDGQTILSGTRKGAIYCSDFRDRPSTRYAYKIKLGEWSVCHVRQLQNENEIVCSGYDDRLLKIDLRTKRPVTCYVEHVNRCSKTPFTVDEGMGVVCCTGQDATTRLWDLHCGSLLTSFPCPAKTRADQIPISLFRTLWGKRTMPVLVTALGDRMFVYRTK